MCAEDQERSGAEAKKVSQGVSWAETRGRQGKDSTIYKRTQQVTSFARVAFRTRLLAPAGSLLQTTEAHGFGTGGPPAAEKLCPRGPVSRPKASLQSHSSTVSLQR